MKIEVSNGELIDKLTILRIKSMRIKEEDKLFNINSELELLEAAASEILVLIPNQLNALLAINEELWAIEDKIRELEARKEFGDEFIKTARLVYLKNDQRFDIKKEINQLTGSTLSEEKSYQPY